MKQAENSFQQAKPIKKGRKMKKQGSKKVMVGQNCSDFGEKETLNEMRHVDSDKMIQLGEANSEQSENEEISKRKRNSDPKQTRFEKDYPGAIIGQMIKAIALLQGQHFKRLYDTLSPKGMLAKTKFVFLCMVMGKYSCLTSLSAILKQKLETKQRRMVKKNKDNPQRLQQGKQSMQKFEEYMQVIAQFLQNNPVLLQIQDFISFIFSQKQSRPGFGYTEQGLKKMHLQRLKQAQWLRNSLDSFDRMMRQLTEESLARHSFIRPNIGGVSLQEAHYQSLEDAPQLFFMEAEEDFF